ncbi:uncharacterized protein LTR77_001249 [Saxophila tyrrhenica]|uniref:Uncharacterized protein n=1 Tax=Saxophila tyrrhenica TaxID=1690608 RepID=A0AAV9PPG3_9PEZI|nr:hypothetical protein LTR77_001249 [Saxophila tyrrhenica]
MRLRRRPTPTELVQQTSDDGLRQPQQSEVPLKAQGLLGTKARRNPVAPRIETPEPLRELLRADQKSLATFPDANGSLGDITPNGGHVMSGPARQRSHLSGNDARTTSNSGGQYAHPRTSGQSVRPNQFYTEQKPSVESINQKYYESARQPPQAFQQTFAPAVRDTAPGKGSPNVQDGAGSPSRATRPLKSAMKQPKSPKESDGPKRSKKLDVMSLFPQPKPANGPLPMLSPAKYSQSPSAVTDNTDYFPQDTVYAQVRRQGPNGRFETYTDATPSPSGPVNARDLPRVKIFDPDLYDEQKIHKRKPPRGIQNWFDGFYISSDDEDQDVKDVKINRDPVELPAEPPLPSPSVLPPSSHCRRTKDASRPPQHHAGYRSRESLRPTLHIQPAPERREHTTIDEVTAPNSAALSPLFPDGQGRLGDQRLAHSQLETESVLALSSEEEEDEDEDERSSQQSSVRDERHVGKASTTMLKRPSIPPRKVHSKTSLNQEVLRKSTSTAQTTGSIPIRLTDSIEVPPVPTPRKVQSPRESNAPISPHLIDLASQHTRSLPASRGGPDRDEMRSAAGETTVTTSSVPTDASHFMAVTDEEMMLLELMRQKRAMMQKNSFAEGYRLALKQEEEHLAKKRSSAHLKALKMLKLREEGKLQPSSSRAESRAESMFSDDSRDQRKKYSMIRKGSVDRHFRLGRFLAGEGAAEGSREATPPASLARLERFLVMKPSLLDAIQDSRPVSGTEIEAESLTEHDDDTFGETINEDDIVDENGVVIQHGAPSPMQRLREMARGSPPLSVSPLAEEASQVETPNDILSDASASRISVPSADEFPTPPRIGVLDDQSPRSFSLLSPPISEDEPLLPDIPARSPNRTPLQVDALRTRPPRTPRQMSDRSISTKQTPESTRFSHRAASKHSEQDYSSPGVDYMSLELPPAVKTGSPSLSTSRASPLTPTFTPMPTVDKPAMTASASDGSSFRDDLIDMSTPEPPSRRPAARPVAERKTSKRQPPKIKTSDGKSLARITSMSSITSAGEDVLAAWAELGGRKGW